MADGEQLSKLRHWIEQTTKDDAGFVEHKTFEHASKPAKGSREHISKAKGSREQESKPNKRSREPTWNEKKRSGEEVSKGSHEKASRNRKSSKEKKKFKNKKSKEAESLENDNTTHHSSDDQESKESKKTKSQSKRSRKNIKKKKNKSKPSKSNSLKGSNEKLSNESYSKSSKGKLSKNSKEKSYNSKEEPDRECFETPADFVITSLGLAVGLGNIWRFPMKAFENGASAFLIPYIVCAFIFGFPAIYMELALGQSSQTTPPIAFRRIMPVLEGVGWMGTTVSFTIAVYYIVLIAWITIYLFDVFTGKTSSMTKCGNPWNVADTCIDMIKQNICSNIANSTEMIFINGGCRNKNEFSNRTLTSASEQYLRYNVIRSSSGLLDINEINYPVFAAMTFCWILTALGIVKGMNIIGKLSYVGVLLPYILIVVLFFRGITLEGASTGLYYYFLNPDFSKVFLTTTWCEALKQLCFSLAIGSSGLMSMASYNKKKNNCFRDTLIIITGDTMMSIVGGAAVFSILGFLAQQRGVTVPEVVESGMSLAFVVYPEAMARLPASAVWNGLFLVMLFFLGISSEMVLVEVLCSCIADQSRTLRKYKYAIVLVTCAFLYAIGLVFCTDAGFYWFEMFDNYAGFNGLITTVVEILVVAYFYGINNFRDDISEMIGSPRNKFTRIFGPSSVYFDWNWRLISPTIGTFVAILSIFRDYPFMNDPKKYPALFDVGGWSTQLISPLMIPLFAILTYYRFRRAKYFGFIHESIRQLVIRKTSEEIWLQVLE
ncbi:unnamed protein product [Caenorhabditis bovis]|uniref:Transporter n=1 Tax=Caenorhabditis bovis TaxID=2654633 RepID=A0A8S1EBK9_9PELO|nr:unnamed protein product [Caenorhabditis bovis]